MRYSLNLQQVKTVVKDTTQIMKNCKLQIILSPPNIVILRLYKAYQYTNIKTFKKYIKLLQLCYSFSITG